MNTCANHKLYALQLIWLIFIFCAGLSTNTAAQSALHQEQAKRWVDSVFQAMTPAERLGQLFAIRAHSDKGPEHIAAVERLLREYHVGGMCFFQGTPEKQAELINRYQAQSKIPLMMSIDGEWGLGMRMKESTISYPRQLMLGAIQNNDLIYDMGKEIARQLRRTGIHVNFAPVVDVNNNPKNPVINTRSFGEDRYNVAVKGYLYARGMQDHGVLACAKHFPGHGDTDVDSHYDLPVINHSLSRLDSIEMYPFKVLAQHGIGSVMVAHLNVPALDRRPNRPTTLSKHTVTQVLKTDLGFEGLIFTDGLEMKGVTKHFKPGEVEAEALLAGNDVLLLPESLAAATAEIGRYLKDGRLSQAQLDASVKKVLLAKYRLGLHQYAPVEIKKIREDLNTPAALAVKQVLIENALTMVRNRDDLVPLAGLAAGSVASLSIGASAKTPFQSRLDSYSKMTHLQSSKEISSERRQELLGQLGKKEVVIVGLHGLSQKASDNFGISSSTVSFLKALNKMTQVVVVVFGNPYSLSNFDEFEWLMAAYEDDKMVQDAAAQAIFGGIGLSGRLPITASARSAFNTGVPTKKNFRMGYSAPEAMGLSSDSLRYIAHIARRAIAARATPGCVVLVAKQGRIIYEEAFGHHTYDKKVPMQTDDVFDLASITKVAATTIAMMHLHDRGLVDIDGKLGDYLPELAGSNKADIVIRDLMAHRAGLQPWIPFYKQTLVTEGKKKKRRTRASYAFYQQQKKDTFVVPVADNLYLRQDFTDSIWQQIIRSPLSASRSYKYSDLGFYLLSRLVHQVSGQPLDAYAHEHFYAPMGLESALFNPRGKIADARIVPSENDRYWRGQELLGYVHDMGAAMLGGVSGHAGLFSNAQDLAVIMQMLLNDGSYGGRQYLQPATVAAFTTRYEGDTRRGIGFDMAECNPARKRNCARAVSKRAFGHVGFTGTAVWADPENDLIYVFLSNRTYPSMSNNKLNKMGTRPGVQSVVYRALSRHDSKVQPDVTALYMDNMPEEEGE